MIFPDALLAKIRLDYSPSLSSTIVLCANHFCIWCYEILAVVISSRYVRKSYPGRVVFISESIIRLSSRGWPLPFALPIAYCMQLGEISRQNEWFILCIILIFSIIFVCVYWKMHLLVRGLSWYHLKRRVLLMRLSSLRHLSFMSNWFNY